MGVITNELQKLHDSRLARTTAWMMAGQVTSYGAQAAYFIVLSRLLGVTQFGVLAGAAAFVGIFAPYGSMGSGIAFMRHVNTERAHARQYLGHILLSSLTMSGALAFGLGLLAAHVLDPKTTAIVWLAAISGCIATPLTISISQIFQTFEMPRTMAAFNIISNAMRLLTALALKFSLHHVLARQWVLADLVISSCVASLAVAAAVRQCGIPLFSIVHFPKGALEGLGYSVSYSASSIYNNFDKTVISHYGMTCANGIYSLAYRIVNFATMPSYAIEMAAVPRLFQKAKGRMSEYHAYGNSLIRRSALYGAVISIPLFFAAPIIPYLVGIGFRPSVMALRWLCLLPLFRGIHEIAGSMLTASGRQKYRLAAQFSAAGTTLILDLLFIPRFGWRGAAWASLTSDALLAALCYGLMHATFSIALRRETGSKF